MSGEQLNRSRRVRVGPCEDDWQLLCLKELHHLGRCMIGCIVQKNHMIISPLWILRIHQLDVVAEEQLHHVTIRIRLDQA
jgi:hypothetical protein